MLSPPPQNHRTWTDGPAAQVAGRCLLLLAVGLYLLYFLHLSADSPSHLPWFDFAKLTDEGWYGAAAIQQNTLGHWYVPGSLNTAVALPVWPMLLAFVFKCFGVSVVATRACTVSFFGGSLLLVYLLLRRTVGLFWTAAALLLLVANTHSFVFNRLAILEPLLVFWFLLALWMASRPLRVPGQALLGLVICLMLLTKTSGVALIPAILYQLWASKPRPRSVLPAITVLVTSAFALLAYYLLLVRPKYLVDFRNFFFINSNTTHLSILLPTFLRTLRDACSIGPALLGLAVLCILASLFWLRPLWREPLFGAAVITIACYLAMITRHGILQPRYFLVLTAPVVILLACTCRFVAERGPAWPRCLMYGVLGVTFVMMTVRVLGLAMHSEYTFASAAQQIALRIRQEPGLLTGASSNEVSLYTGVPAFTDSLTPDPQEVLFHRYRPGWMVTWGFQKNGPIDAVAKFATVEKRGEFHALDAPGGSDLVLYRVYLRESATAEVAK